MALSRLPARRPDFFEALRLLDPSPSLLLMLGNFWISLPKYHTYEGVCPAADEVMSRRDGSSVLAPLNGCRSVSDWGDCHVYNIYA